MKIFYSSQFIKHYKKRIKRHANLKNRFKERVNLFMEDRDTAILKDHKLRGEKKDFRAFSITGDIRVIYIEEDSETVIFIDVGSHSQIYGM